MSELEKKEVEPAEETQTEPEMEPDTDTEETDAEPSQPDIDYEALLAKERERAEAAEQAIIKSKIKKKKVEEPESDDDDDDDKPLTRKDVERIQQDALRVAYGDRIGEIAKEMAGTDQEAQLIVHIHKNRTFPADLSLREQLEEAWAIANRRKILAQNQELARALKGKDGVNDNPAGTHRDPMEGTAPRMAAQDKASYERAGFKYDVKTRVWVKDLPNGKKAYKDPKTKKITIS